MSTAKDVKKTKKQKIEPLNNDPLALNVVGDLAHLLDDPAGKPREISLDMISEDPSQPRTEDNPGFSAESLNELAASIKERGVKSPISVHADPILEGRFIVNHGARRLRASRIAGKKTIPVFVDGDFTDVDQMVENIQRDDLTPREIANFIGRKLAEGVKSKDLAALLGKSKTFISLYSNLLNLPGPIEDAYNEGRLRDLTLISTLLRFYKTKPDIVTDFLSRTSNEITRQSLSELNEYLYQNENQVVSDNKNSTETSSLPADESKPDEDNAGIVGGNTAGDKIDTGAGEGAEREPSDEPKSLNLATNSPTSLPVERDENQSQEDPSADLDDFPPENVTKLPESVDTKTSDFNELSVDKPDKLKKAILRCKHDGRFARLLYDRRPSAEGMAWLKYEDDGQEFESRLTQVKLIALIEG